MAEVIAFGQYFKEAPKEKCPTKVSDHLEIILMIFSELKFSIVSPDRSKASINYYFLFLNES
jgi:hypothetical protein